MRYPGTQLPDVQIVEDLLSGFWLISSLGCQPHNTETWRMLSNGMHTCDVGMRFCRMVSFVKDNTYHLPDTDMSAR